MHQATLYRKANCMQRRDAEQIIKEYSPIIQWRNEGADTLLDVGSGTGDVLLDFLYPHLPERFELLLGTDISDKMVQFADEGYSKFDRIKFKVLDISVDELPPSLCGNFDHVTSFYCLHWVQKQKQALKNIYNLLRPDSGDCLLVFLADNPLFHVYKALAKLPKWSSYMERVDEFISPLSKISQPSVEYGKLLQEVGFAEHSVEVRHLLYVYNNVQSLKDNVRAVCPCLENIPKIQHEEFLDDIISIVMKMKLHEENKETGECKFKCSYKLIVAYARKAAGYFNGTFENN